MANIEKNIQYLEGKWAGSRMVHDIERTTYGSLKNAIETKHVLIDQFETQFGFSRDMGEPDSKYAYELGILDALKEEYAKTKEVPEA